jgi:hypothetical protein
LVRDRKAESIVGTEDLILAFRSRTAC